MNAIIVVEGQEVALHPYSSNELSLIRMGEDPESFDHHIWDSIEEIE